MYLTQLVYPNDGEKDEKTVTRLACDLQHVISNCHLSFRSENLEIRDMLSFLTLFMRKI